MNQALEKARNIFALWDSGEGDVGELAIGLYDLAAHYEALLEDFAQLEDKLEAMVRYSAHLPECWKNMSLRELGVGGPLASCSCGYSELLATQDTPR